MSIGPDSDPSPSVRQPPPIRVRLQVPRTAPVWTYVILAVNVVVFAAGALLGPDLVLGMGAKVNRAIIAGQVWRLVTAMFLHVDLLHIAFNSYALLIFGRQVEQPYGRVRFLLIYLLSGLSGSALSFLLSPSPSVGASGAIFGLIGVVGAYLYRYRDRLVAGRARLANILSIVAYNLLYGFVSFAVDNWAHIGGLLAGMALGWFLAPRYRVLQPDALAPPRMVDESSFLGWLRGIALVATAIGLALLGGFLRWGG